MANSFRNTKYGVPQGTVLGPLLFLIYINDFPNSINHPMVLFADDSTVIFDETKENLEIDINNTLTNLIQWLTNNNLMINIEKTYIMHFKNRSIETHDVQIKHDGKPVNEIEVTKFLGLSIDSRLTWKSQIEQVCKRLQTFSYALYMLAKVVDVTAVLTAYYGHVESILRYGLIFWGNSTDIEKVLKIQKKCVRAIVGIPQDQTCKPHFIGLGILTLTSLYIYEVSVFVRSNRSLFETMKSDRRKNIIRTESCKTTLFTKSIFGMAPKIYNKVPKYIRDVNTMHSFKDKLRKFLRNKAYYNINEYLNDLF